MNEELRKAGTINILDERDRKVEKGYSKYFEKIYQPPSLKEARKRGKQNINYNRDFHIEDKFEGMGKGRTFLIKTYGCQMNAHDTEVMAGILQALGYTATEDINEADVILINTCAIRENAENKVFSEIGNLKHLKKNRPEALIGVCGCMSQEESVVNKILKSYQNVDMIFGTHNIHKLPEILEEAYLSKAMVVEVWSKEGDIIENLPKVREGSTKAWVNIMYGCDKFCTYCIVPFTRGKERSRRPEDIIEEVRGLARDGYKEITLLGQNVNSYGKDISMIFQDPMTSLNPTMQIGKQVMEPLIKHRNYSKSEAKKRALEILNLVGLPNAEKRFKAYPHQFSGGQRQRIVIATALACEPKVLIADEPTTALDVTMQAQILDLMKDLQKKIDTSIIFITHDLGVVANIADRVAVMYGGQMIETGNVEEIFYDPKHPYTWGLLSSMPDLTTSNDTELIAIPGTPPDLLHPPKGDAFARRSQYALDIDFKQEPPWFKMSPTHFVKSWLLDERAPKVEPPEMVKQKQRHMPNNYDKPRQVERVSFNE